MYQDASSRKLKIYNQNEIRTAKGLEKVRRQFWNSKAEDVYRDKSLRTWPKTALHGVIDTSWFLKKTTLFVLEANKIFNEKKENKGITKQKEGTLAENLKRTLSIHSDLLSMSSKLAALNDPNNTARDKKNTIQKLERSAREVMGELKKAKESTRKAIENRDTGKNWKSYYVPEEIIIDTSEPTPDDISGMLRAVLDRTWPTDNFQELSNKDNE